MSVRQIPPNERRIHKITGLGAVYNRFICLCDAIIALIHQVVNTYDYILVTVLTQDARSFPLERISLSFKNCSLVKFQPKEKDGKIP